MVGDTGSVGGISSGCGKIRDHTRKQVSGPQDQTFYFGVKLCITWSLPV